MKESERNRRFRKERTARLRRRTAIQRDAAKEIARLLKVAETRVLAVLATAPTDFQQFYLPQVQQAIRQAMGELEAGMAARLNRDAGASWQAGIDLVEKPIEAGGLRIAAVLPQIDTRQLVAMRAFLTDRMKDISTTLANRINSELGLIAIGAQSPGEATTNIARILKTGGRSRAITIIRTELGRAFSAAAQQRFSQARKLLPGLKKQWRRSGKTHSRPEHDRADGQIQPVDEPFQIFTKRGAVSLMYPRDPAGPAEQTINCGCESLPVMESWEMKTPGRKPFTPEELAKSPLKRALAGGTRVA